jgi:hypothetical protein
MDALRFKDIKAAVRIVRSIHNILVSCQIRRQTRSVKKYQYIYWRRPWLLPYVLDGAYTTMAYPGDGGELKALLQYLTERVPDRLPPLPSPLLQLLPLARTNLFEITTDCLT